MTPSFDHEKLNAYRHSIAFNGWVGELLDRIEKKAAVKDQLDRAATSIPLNIAEGNGKFSVKDRARYFDVARGSALESAACMDVLLSRSLIDRPTHEAGKTQLVEIVKTLIGLLRRFGYDFPNGDSGLSMRETPGSDAVEQEQEQEKEQEQLQQEKE